jgi:hypothetical protein
MFKNLANATVRIECGNSKGSGFHFIKEDIIVTNHHVIEPLFNGAACIAITEENVIFQLKLIDFSHKTQYDFAIFEIINKNEINNRSFLKPKTIPSIERGTEILFSGYPHGIPDLLIHKAIISSPLKDFAFYIDGNINGGNSGGPIIEITDNNIIGIITQRRFLGGKDLEQLSLQAQQLGIHCQQVASHGSVQIMGVDFGNFASLMSQSLLLIDEVLRANANAGIGIGFLIKFVEKKCNDLGIA